MSGVEHRSGSPGAPGTSGDGERSRFSPHWIVLILLLAYGLRMVAVFQYEDAHPLAESLLIDERSYDAWAQEIASGDWVGEGVFFQEPLYPYWVGTFYAATSTDRTGLRHAQVFLGAVTVGLVFLLTRRMFGAPAALAAALLVALHAPLLLLPAFLLKPNLFLPVLVGLALLLVAVGERGGRLRWLGVGVLAGLGALLRGNLLILLPAIVLWPFLRALLPGFQSSVDTATESAGHGVRSGRVGRALLASAMIALGIAAVLAPVIARNAVVGGVPALTTSGAGTNVFGGNNADNPYGIATEFDWVRGIPEHEADDWRHEAERRLGRELDAGEVSRYWLGEVAASLQREPGLHARIFWNKLRLSLGAYEVPDNHHLEWDARYVPLLRAPFPGWGVLGSLGLAGLLLALFRRVGGGPREVALLFALYLATIVLTVTSMRIRLALVPLLAPFAGFYAVELLRLLRPPRDPRVLLPLLVSLPVVFVPVFDRAERAEEFLERDFNLAVHLLWSGAPGDLLRAEDLALELDRARPGSPSVLNLLAEVELLRATALLAGAASEADLTEARAEATPLLQSALTRLRTVVMAPDASPRDTFRANAVAARVDLLLGQWERAERRLREALVFDPEDPALREQLARALLARAAERASGPASKTERAPLVREARAILTQLASETDDPVVAQLLAELEAGSLEEQR